MDLRTQVMLVPFITLFVAFATPLLLKLRRPKSRIGWVLWSADTGLVVWVLCLQIDWTLCSEYLRYLAPVLAAYCIVTTFPRDAASTGERKTSLDKIKRGGAFCAGIAVLGLLTSLLFELHTQDTTAAVALRWPLEAHRVFVVQGGASELRNHHVPVPAQQRALDIVALGWWGGRMHGLFPKALSEYEVYGAKVSAPCTGRIELLEANQPDHPPLDPDDDEHLAGNFVAIFCPKENVSVVLAHLQPGTHLTMGQELRAGTRVGRVGNSGNSSEPHLHVHALPGRVRTADDLLGGGTAGIAMTFGGRRLARGDNFRSN
jgi:hypothetical protein